MIGLVELRVVFRNWRGFEYRVSCLIQNLEKNKSLKTQGKMAQTHTFPVNQSHHMKWFVQITLSDLFKMPTAFKGENLVAKMEKY